MLEMDRLIRPQVFFFILTKVSTTYVVLPNFVTTLKLVFWQGFIIIRDNESVISRIRNIAPKFLWDVDSYVLEDQQKRSEPVLIFRKKFWAIN